jgi:hypothetical protein
MALPMYIRNSPVERSEVVIDGPHVDGFCGLGKFRILTLPINACPPDEWGMPRLIKGLIEPLLQELKDEYSAWKEEQIERAEKFRLEGGTVDGWRIARGNIEKTPYPEEVPYPTGYRDCLHCGNRFAYCGGHSRIRYCSNACIDAGKATTRAQWSMYRGNRRSNRRGCLDCKHCGKRLEAKHANKQYCSVRCRVAAHRAKRTAIEVNIAISEVLDGCIPNHIE